MAQITEEQLRSCFEAYRRKTEYEQQMKEYEKKSGLAKLFSARPADPAKGFSVQELKTLTEKAFKDAYSNFENEYLDKDGIRKSTWLNVAAESPGKLSVEFNMKTATGPYQSVMHHEEMALKDGYGLVKTASSDRSTLAPDNMRLLNKLDRWRDRPIFHDLAAGRPLTTKR